MSDFAKYCGYCNSMACNCQPLTATNGTTDTPRTHLITVSKEEYEELKEMAKFWELSHRVEAHTGKGVIDKLTAAYQSLLEQAEAMERALESIQQSTSHPTTIMFIGDALEQFRAFKKKAGKDE